MNKNIHNYVKQSRIAGARKDHPVLTSMRSGERAHCPLWLHCPAHLRSCQAFVIHENNPLETHECTFCGAENAHLERGTEPVLSSTCPSGTPSDLGFSSCSPCGPIPQPGSQCSILELMTGRFPQESRNTGPKPYSAPGGVPFPFPRPQVLGFSREALTTV